MALRHIVTTTAVQNSVYYDARVLDIDHRDILCEYFVPNGAEQEKGGREGNNI